MSYKAVLFDLDGTLVDGTDIVLGAFKYTLGTYREPYDEAKVKRGIGRVLEQQYEVLAPGHDSKELADFHRTWQAENRHLYRTFPGFEALMNGLREAGFKVAAFTSAARSRTDIALDTLDIRHYFDAIICGDELTKPKPDAEGIKILATRLDVKLPEVIVVGDAVHDIESGKNAGVLTIAITHGFGTMEALEEANPDYTVGNLQDLQELVEKLLLDK